MNEETQNDAKKDVGDVESPVDYTPSFLKKIGITRLQEELETGYIKVLPSDFIVEEISLDGVISTIETVEETKNSDQTITDKPQVEFDLVKSGIATVEAARRIAEELKLELHDIKYAGLKDSKAITSQKIVIPGKTPEDISKIDQPNIFIKNIKERKGTLNTGDLKGNRFTILIRTKSKNNNSLLSEVNKVKKIGFPNFFSFQRFGTRLLTHKVGEEIINGDYEKAARILIMSESEHEGNTYRHIRKDANNLWGKWSELRELFLPHASYFAAEIAILGDLMGGSNCFQAFKNQEWTTKLFIRAYTAYYFNRLLSVLSQRSEALPEKIPFLSKNAETIELYKNLLPKEDINYDGILSFPLEHIISNKKIEITSRIFPEIKLIGEVNQGYIFVFDLEKGAYATTFLSNFFNLKQFGQYPDWLSQSPIDTMKITGRQSLEEIKKSLK